MKLKDWFSSQKSEMQGKILKWIKIIEHRIKEKKMHIIYIDRCKINSVKIQYHLWTIKSHTMHRNKIFNLIKDMHKNYIVNIMLSSDVYPPKSGI